MHGRDENFGGASRRWEENIKMDLKVKGFEVMNICVP
jgi:hypothetical protein